MAITKLCSEHWLNFLPPPSIHLLLPNLQNEVKSSFCGEIDDKMAKKLI